MLLPADIDARYYKDRTRPQVDLVGTYNPTGLAGSLVAQGPNPLTAGFADLFTRVNDLSTLSGLPPIPPATISGGSVPSNLVGGYPQSLSNLLALRYPTVRVGVRISLPLGNETAKANLGRSLVEGSRIKTQRAQAEQIIEADVRNTLQAVRSAEARLASAAASRASTELQYTSEQRRLDAGTSTVYLVLQRQTELVAAHLARFNIEWHIIPAERAVEIDTDEYRARLYSMIKRKLKPHEYQKTSHYRALMHGHQRHQGRIVGVETTPKPRYLPGNRQHYGTPYGFDDFADPLTPYFERAGLVTEMPRAVRIFPQTLSRYSRR